jgi:hypothetical protein
MLTIAGIGVAGVVVIGGTATAASEITAHQLATGAVNSRVVKDGSVHMRDMTTHVNTLLQKSNLDGAVYRVANYTNGGDGWATVACADTETKSQRFVAISGGVQGYSDSNNPSAGLSVTSSFPGRMDWSTNTPKPDRLDGWVVGLTGGDDTTLKVWALCVPKTDISVQTTDY